MGRSIIDEIRFSTPVESEDVILYGNEDGAYEDEEEAPVDQKTRLKRAQSKADGRASQRHASGGQGQDSLVVPGQYSI